MASRIEIFFPVKEEVIHTVIERGVLFGIGGPAGQGVPAGGTTGQQLRKKSNTDFDSEWFTPDNAVTAGDIANWNAAYGWGNHSAAGYLTAASAAASYQPLNAGLTAIAALSGSGLVRKTGLNTYAVDNSTYLTAETDPVFSASAAFGISSGNISSWNTAASWGNHALAGYLTAETDPVFLASAAAGISSGNIANWNTAFGWGNHASAGYLSSVSAAALYQPLDGDLSAIAALAGTSGLLRKTAANTWSLDTNTYLTSFTETDPVFTASAAAGITGTNISNWNTAFGWGNHASAGYATTSAVAAGYQPLDGDLTSIAGLAGTSGLLRKTAANTWSLDTNTYLTSFTETDPVFSASAASGITAGNISNWNTAFSWGNHASAGYVTTAGARSAISLTTTGTSGAATYNSSTGVLNIPNYATGGGGSLTVGTSAISGGTAGRLLFEGAGNVLQESANLFWDTTNSRLGVGINTGLTAAFHTRGAGTTNSTFSFRAENNTGTRYLQYRDDGLLQIYNPDTATTGSWNGYDLVVWRVGRSGQGLINFDGEFAFRDETNATNLVIAGSTSRFLKNLGINTTGANNASAALQVDSTTRGFLPPRMDSTQRNAIGTPAAGLLIYNTTSGALEYRNASSWVTIGAGGSETDPVFTASAAFSIAAGDITNWNSAFGWGNHASAGYLTTSVAASTYQPLDSDLTAIAALSTNGLARRTGAGTWSIDTTAYVDQAGARSAISLTTTGTSGAATYNSGTGVLNIPNYATGGGGGMTVTEVTGTSQTIAVNNGYIANNASQVAFALPTTAAVGDRFFVKGKGAGGWRINQAAGQQIIWDEGGVDGTNETTAGTGGYIESTDDYDFIELICLTANTIFSPLASKGNINLV